MNALADGLLTDDIQLGFALEAFGLAHQMGVGWTTMTLLFLKASGINSISDLATGCKDRTVNLDLELFGCPPENRFSAPTLQKLNSFLPGPVGHRCFRLAQHISRQVEKGHVQTEYVHRPENGKIGDEEWTLKYGDQWVVNVDCAGFVRNALKHVTKNPFVMALSDRDFMRAKDFYDFFSTIPFTVMDTAPIPEKTRLMKWRIVTDLKYVIPGDIICYRPKGSSAGGAAFTTNDRKDLNHLLKAVRVAQLWHEIRDTGALVTKNMARDPRVKPWVKEVKTKLASIDIFTIKELYDNITTLNASLKEKNLAPFKPQTLELLRECCETTASNTGHIVFASGPAQLVGENEYRIRVVHSTKYGKKDENGNVTTGVQEYFRRFTRVEEEDGTVYWTRGMRVEKNNLTEKPADTDDDDEDENPHDDMEDESPTEDEEEDDGNSCQVTNPNSGEDAQVEQHDDLAGQSQIEVIAARMCF